MTTCIHLSLLPSYLLPATQATASSHPSSLPSNLLSTTSMMQGENQFLSYTTSKQDEHQCSPDTTAYLAIPFSSIHPHSPRLLWLSCCPLLQAHIVYSSMVIAPRCRGEYFLHPVMISLPGMEHSSTSFRTFILYLTVILQSLSSAN